MSTAVQDTVLQLLPNKRRRSTNGWVSFDAVCCHHRGERPDTRGRGGIITNADGTVTYHCFNCQFRTSYRPGWFLGYKFRQLLNWLGAETSQIQFLVIESIRLRDQLVLDGYEYQTPVEIDFPARSMPSNLDTVENDPLALKYCQQRAIDLNTYPLLVSTNIEHNLNRRVIIPFTWRNKIIGYTARAWDDNIKPKYYSNYEPNFVFNIDNQKRRAQFVIVCEGPFDAMSIDGVAILSNECKLAQADIINDLEREVIVVPDRDRSGVKLVDAALEYGWSVAFPVWYETSKDINDAVVRYGKLFTLKSILDSKESSPLKIQLKAKKLV